MRRLALLAASLATALAFAAPRASVAADPTPREKFLKDGDAKALAAALSASADPADGFDAALAGYAAAGAMPGSRIPAPGSPLLSTLTSLSLGEVEKARAVAGWEQDPSVRASWLRALVDARGGDDEGATTRLLAPPAPTAADAFSLALLGAALPADDRRVLAFVAARAAVRAAGEGKAALASALAEGAAYVDGASASRSLVSAARALRRAGKPTEALMLLVGPAAARAGLGGAALRLDRALSRWRLGDVKGAKGEASAVAAPTEFTWAYEAITRAAGTAPGGAPVPPVAAGADADAWAIAALATALGVPSKAEDVAAKAKAKGSTTSDPSFRRAWLSEAGIASIPVAGDAVTVAGWLQKGLPVVVWRLTRRGERFRDVPHLVRAVDPATGLLVLDAPDADAIDVAPTSWLAKSRAMLAVPAARAAELEGPRGSSEGRLGAALADALSALASSDPSSAAPRLLARVAEFPGQPIVDLYAGYASYVVALGKDDTAGLARWSAALQRSSATGPVLGVERFALSERALSRSAVDEAIAALDEAARADGEAAHLLEARALALGALRRIPAALAAVDAAVALDPLEGRLRRRRAALREVTGDTAGARSDLARVLDRTPDDLASADGYCSLSVRAGDFARALEVAAAAEKAAAGGPRAATARDLRRGVEAAAVTRAARAEDLVPVAKSADPEIRGGVAAAATRFDGPVADDLLRALLSDPDPVVRRKAALGHAKPSLVARAATDAALLSSLTGPLATDPEPAVREALAAVLSTVKAPAAVSALAARLSGPGKDPAASVRSVIATGIGSKDGGTARRALVAALSDDEPAVRTTAIRALSRWTGTDRGFRPDDPPAGRAAAVKAWEEWAAAGAR